MKKYVLITALLALATTGCFKEKDNVTPQATTNPNPPTTPPTTNNVDDSYIINGIADIKMGNYDKATLNLLLEFKSGAQKNVSLYAKDLPEFCKASFTPQSGIPGYVSTLTINTYLAKPGTYPVTIASSASDGKTNTYKFILTIVDKLDCDSFLIKAVNEDFKTTKENDKAIIHSNTSLTSKYDSSLMKTVIMLDNIYLQDHSSGIAFYNYNKALYLLTDCTKRTVTIPEQRIQGRRLTTTIAYKDFDITGSGTIDPEKGMLTITYTTKDNGSVISTFTMTTPIKL